MCGVAAITIAVLPQLLEPGELPVPLWLVGLVNLAQSGAYLALAVWAGIRLAPRVGLAAPAFAAAAAGRGFVSALRPQIAPGVVGGLVGAAIILIAGLLEPGDIAAAADDLAVPLLARVLYGGITEELLIRWGLMTALVWLLWVLLRRRRGRPRADLFWAAILLSAIPFGAGHLPLVAAAAGGLTAATAVWVVGANAVFGVLAGFLYWRFGLESAMVAHCLAHVFDTLARFAFPI